MVDVISHLPLPLMSPCAIYRRNALSLAAGRRQRGRGRIRTGSDWSTGAALVPVLLQSLSGTLFLTVFFVGFGGFYRTRGW